MDFLKSAVLDVDRLTLRIKEGSAAIFPTDTLPALAALPEYVSQIWHIKKRSLEKPLILMGSDPKLLFESVASIAMDDAWQIAENYWPGPLTMVLPASGEIARALNPGRETLGIRVPSCEMARDLLLNTGPLATTSVNFSGKSPALNFDEAAHCFPDLPLLGPLPWSEPSGVASTVISWQHAGCWKVLRSGSVLPDVRLLLD